MKKWKRRKKNRNNNNTSLPTPFYDHSAFLLTLFKKNSIQTFYRRFFNTIVMVTHTQNPFVIQTSMFIFIEFVSNSFFLSSLLVVVGAFELFFDFSIENSVPFSLCVEYVSTCLYISISPLFNARE